MTAKDINKALYTHFDNYEYKLNNTIVFDWESDFFAQSKSGYFVECEVKISRSDFFVDFKKPKHSLFQEVMSGKSHHIYRYADSWHGDYLGVIREPYLALDRSKVDTNKPLIERNFIYGTKSGKPMPLHMRKRYIVNDWDFDRISIRYDERQNWARTSRIQIKPIVDIHCPHQYYFAAPKGLLRLEEIPKYAGLLVVNDQQRIECLKRAPYLHKRSMDLDKILLKKYYNLWRFKVPYETKQAIRNNYSE